MPFTFARIDTGLRVQALVDERTQAKLRFFSDEWVSANWHPETDNIDYDVLNGVLAKGLKSDWRVVTPKILKAIRRAEITKLLKGA